MHWFDYFRLSSAAIWAHKKRVLLVTTITGLLFSVIAVGYFILQGLENQIMPALLDLTAGKVLLMSKVDLEYCQEEEAEGGCNQDALIAAMKANLQHYGGTLLSPAQAGLVRTKSGLEFIRVDKSLFPNLPDYDGEASEVLLSINTAMRLADVMPAAWETPISQKIATIEQTRERAIGKVIGDDIGDKYYIADILPSSMYQTNLSFAIIGQEKNPLSFLLGQIDIGNSRDILLSSAQSVQGADLPLTDTVLAYFDDIEQAYGYLQDEANQCTYAMQISGHCTSKYAVETSTLIGNPVTVYSSFRRFWQIYNIFALILMVVAIIIMVSTYGRLLSRDGKTIALYYAMGATKMQIKLIYLIYLLMLSLITIVFALIVGLVLALVLSLANQASLRQVFTVALGVTTRDIWLVGWNWLFVGLAGCILLAPFITMILQGNQFKNKSLGRDLK